MLLFDGEQIDACLTGRSVSPLRCEDDVQDHEDDDLLDRREAAAVLGVVSDGRTGVASTPAPGRWPHPATPAPPGGPPGTRRAGRGPGTSAGCTSPAIRVSRVVTRWPTTTSPVPRCAQAPRGMAPPASALSSTLPGCLEPLPLRAAAVGCEEDRVYRFRHRLAQLASDAETRRANPKQSSSC